MLSPQQTAALRQFYAAAQASGHIFPQMAACEAVVESAWGTSKLVHEACNIFGCKQHTHPIYGTVNMPTREFLHGHWVVESDDFVKYPDLASSFKDRMATLHTLAGEYPHYSAALAATTPEGFVTEVSKTWSTDPNRAATCISIFHAHRDLLQ